MLESSPCRDRCVFATNDQHDEREIRVAGELDFATTAELERLITSADRPCVAIHCADVSFIDSMTVNVLVRAHQATEDGGPRLVLRHPSKTVVELLQICRLDEAFTIETDARKPLLKQAPEKQDTRTRANGEGHGGGQPDSNTGEEPSGPRSPLT